MKQGMRGILALVAVLVSGGAARASTSLAFVTPKNLKAGKFQVTRQPAGKDSVRFRITRDIRGIDGPGRRASKAWSTTSWAASCYALGAPTRPKCCSGAPSTDSGTLATWPDTLVRCNGEDTSSAREASWERQSAT